MIDPSEKAKPKKKVRFQTMNIEIEKNQPARLYIMNHVRHILYMIFKSKCKEIEEYHKSLCRNPQNDKKFHNFQREGYDKGYKISMLMKIYLFVS